jgi:hypothetical protein
MTTRASHPVCDILRVDYLLHSDGHISEVHDTGAELVPLAAWTRHLAQASARRCACGRPCGSLSSRTCGEQACIEALS